MSLFEAISRSWQPSKTALVAGDERVTFAELTDRVARTRTWLLTRGIGRDDVVAAQLGKQPAFLELFLATVSLGAVFLPLHAEAPQAECDAITTARARSKRSRARRRRCRSCCACAARARARGPLSADEPCRARSAARVARRDGCRHRQRRGGIRR